MKVMVCTIGTRGDVQPYIALSLGLEEAGYEVTLASHPGMEALVKSHGIRFQPIGPDVNVGKAAAAIRGRSRNWMLGLIRVMQFTVSTIEQASPDILELCREADLVVTHSFAGAAEADKLGKPTVSVTLQHQAIPTPDPSQSILKRTVRNLAAIGMGMMMVRPYNKLRKRIGAPTVKGVEEMMSLRLNMIPISPLVVPRDTRWAPQHRLTATGQAPCLTATGQALCLTATGQAPCLTATGQALCLTATGQALCLTATGQALCLTATGQAGISGKNLVESWQPRFSVILPRKHQSARIWQMTRKCAIMKCTNAGRERHE
ncbi:MAG: glycosyltransferase [Anaerolineae bacterium]|jgi:hypothetical protein